MQAFFYLPTGVNLIMFDLFRVKRGLFSAASVLAISFIVMPNVAESQTTAGIRGTISDADGSPLTNAVVKVVNPETGFVREVSVSNEGNYVVRNLPAGTNYDVSISAPGEFVNVTTVLLEPALLPVMVQLINFALLSIQAIIVPPSVRFMLPVITQWEISGFA